MTETNTQTRASRQTLAGKVVSTKMDKTVVVAVERTIMHTLYQRYLRRNKRFHAHDETNECRVGDQRRSTLCAYCS